MTKSNQKEVKEADVVHKNSFGHKLKRQLIKWVILFCCGVIVYFGGRLWWQQQQTSTEKTEIQITSRIQDLEQQMQRMDKKFAAIENQMQKQVQSEQKIMDIIGSVEETLRQDLQNYVDGKVIAPQGKSVETAQPMAEILLANGAMIIRDLAEQGESINYETEVLQILAQDNLSVKEYVDTIKGYAASGLKGKKQLIADFNRLYPTLSSAHVKQENSTEEIVETEPLEWLDKLFLWFKKIVIVRKGSHQIKFESTGDDVYNLVNEGNLQEALTMIASSEKYQKIESEALQQWVQKAKAYLDFNHAVNGLIMNSLAQLHMKEMEH